MSVILLYCGTYLLWPFQFTTVSTLYVPTDVDTGSQDQDADDQNHLYETASIESLHNKPIPVSDLVDYVERRRSDTCAFMAEYLVWLSDISGGVDWFINGRMIR